MGYTTFGTLLSWLEQPAGKTVRDNRRDLVMLANDIRQHFYSLYEKVQMFMDLRECFCVQEFISHCDPCQKRFHGITLPHYVQQAESMKVAGVPVTMFNKWREWNPGFIPSLTCQTRSLDQSDGFCTERDIGAVPCRLKIMAKTAQDCGKVVRLTYWDRNGQKNVDELRLTLDYQPSGTEAVRFDHPAGVVFVQALEGGAVIALDNERSEILSEYYPGESVINYRRLRLENVCPQDVIELKASRRYTPLFFDHDIVESDNKQAFVEMAMAFKFTRSPSLDPAVLTTGQWHENRAKQYLIGEKARDEGGNQVRRINLLGPHKHRSGLPSRRRIPFG